MRRPDKIRVDIDDLEKGQMNIYTGSPNIQPPLFSFENTTRDIKI